MAKGTLEYLDRLAGRLQARMGTEDRIAFFWVHQDELPTWCFPPENERRGCALAGEAVALSAYVADGHELVHAARSELEFSHRFIEEGLANSWGNFPEAPDSGPARDTIRDRLPDSHEGMGTNDYHLSSDFVGYLLATEGYPLIDDLTASTGYASDYDALIDAFPADRSLEELIDDFVGAAGCGPRGVLEAVAACDAEPDFRCGEDEEQLIRVAVDEPSVVGPTPGGQMFRQLTFEAPEDGLYFFSLVGAEGNATVRSCRPGCQPLRTIEADPDGVSFLELEAGVHSITFAQPMGESVEYTISCTE